MEARLERARGCLSFQNTNLTSLHSLPSPSQTNAKPDPLSHAFRNPTLDLPYFLSLYRASAGRNPAMHLNHNPLNRSVKLPQIFSSHVTYATCSYESNRRSGTGNTSIRCFRARSPGVDREKLAELIDLIVKNEDDVNGIGTKLGRMNPMLSHAMVAELLRSLSNRGVSALGFFNWLLNSNSGSKPSAEIHNLVVDNLGRLDDYKSMVLLLKELSLRGHCLTEKAFAFLTACSSSNLIDVVKRVTEILNAAGGSCRASGIYSLIKVLCAMRSFDLAIFVMEKTARKTSYYNLLIAAKCQNGYFQDARDLFDEMRRFGCHPSIASYNYLLGSLFKNRRFAEGCELLETMEELGYLPDSVTYEVLIVHACKAKRMDFASEILNQMMSEGIRPRMTTYAAFIKGYFWSGRVEDAHKYVVDMNMRDKCSGNMNYSLLAMLFQISGRVVEAGSVLREMMEKGLRPNFPVYMKITKDLCKMSSRDLASQLKSMYVKFDSSIDVG